MRTGVVIAACLVLAAAIPFYGAATAQDPFPDGPGRDTLLLACSQCHSIGRMLTAELTADDWEFIVYDMIARGAPVHAEDVDGLTQYLQKNFASDED